MASSKEFKSREDWKKEKELEEARKAGSAPALKDEEGRDINPHIPQYIANAPWYLARNAPSLKHQRMHKEDGKIALNEWYARGVKTTTATKFRKGACENCGAVTHKAKDCVDRPRKKGAKWTNSNIKPDEYVQNIELDFDSKRDRWNGYDPAMYEEVERRYAKTEQLRKQMRQKELASKFITEPDPAHKRYPHSKENKQTKEKSLVPVDSDSESDEGDVAMNKEERKDFEDSSMLLQSMDSKTRTTIRNLRIREDTAKYLRNLSLDSAYYDPKTRSMRENPTPHKPLDEQVFAGDNFVRSTGDTTNFANVQCFSWEAYDKGQDIHVQAAPSQAELLHKQFLEKKKDLNQMQKEAILKKYGGDQKELPNELRFAQTENYVEYAKDGTLIKGQENKAVARSKYEEDVFRNNHKSIWGSYWENGEWGYACCKQTVRNSYCTGESGRMARDIMLHEMQHVLEEKQRHLAENELKPKGQKTKEEKKKEEKEKQEKLEKALRDEEEKQKKYVEKDERKRKYNSLSHDTYEVTEEEMEAYNVKKIRAEDPMAAFLRGANAKA